MTSSHTANSSRRDERSGAERCWIYRDSYHYPQVSFVKPGKHIQAVEYMRVMSRDEVERLGFGEDGVDAIQLINSLHRTIEGQRRHIASLQAKVNRPDERSNENV